MRFGKFEISEFALIMISLFIIICAIIVADTKLQIEQERTKQIEIQQTKEIKNEFENIK